MDIKFSILVPVYQVERYIDDCIQSVLNQTYTNWELILVDDGSKDKSGEICDRYAEEDSRIWVHHKANKGLIHTRRYGIVRATGDYYVFLDSDDWLKSNTLEKIYYAIQKYNADCVIYGFERILEGNVFQKSAEEKECCIVDKRTLYKKCLYGAYNPLWRKTVKADVFKRMDGNYSLYEHISVGEDLLQSIEIMEKCDEVAFIGDRLYNYRVNPKSIMETMTENGWRQYLEVCYHVLDFLQEQSVMNEEDIAEYKAICMNEIHSYIIMLCISENSYQRKVQMLQEVRELKLYERIFLAEEYDKEKIGLKTKLCLQLFWKKKYRELILICSLYKKLQKRGNR